MKYYLKHIPATLFILSIISLVCAFASSDQIYIGAFSFFGIGCWVSSLAMFKKEKA